MKRKYREWTDEDLTKAVKDSKSIAQVLRTLELRVSGGNYWNIKRNIDRLNLDISHFTGQVWNRGMYKPLGELINPTAIKKNIIRARGLQCEECRNTHWLGEQIPIELHHINGNNADNRNENLQLLCPNCHSFTEFYRNRK